MNVRLGNLFLVGLVLVGYPSCVHSMDPVIGGGIIIGEVALPLISFIAGAAIRHKFIGYKFKKKRQLFIKSEQSFQESHSQSMPPEGPCSICAAKKNGAQIRHTYDVKLCSLPEGIEKLFGYNPHIRLIEENCSSVSFDPKHPTLMLNGFTIRPLGGQFAGGHDAVLLKQVIPGNLLALDLLDSRYRNMFKSSFAQMYEILPVISVLKYVVLDQVQAHSVNLWGFSRGGDLVVTVLSVLSDRQGTYEQDLQRIGITDQDREHILQAILNGVHVIGAPLKKDFGNESCALFCRNYRSKGIKTEEAKYRLHSSLKIVVHLQLGDKNVGNEGDAEFFKALAEQNPDSTYLCLGHNFLHTSSAEFENGMHAIYKKYGAAHNKLLAKKYPKAEGFVKLGQINNDPEKYVSEYYTKYTELHGKQLLQKNAKNPIITSEKPLHINATWSEYGFSIYKKSKKILFKQLRDRYLIDEKMLTCKQCNNLLALYDDKEDVARINRLKELGRSLYQNKHVCMEFDGSQSNALLRK